MKDLKINRDIKQPSDEELLKHQNFDEVLKKAGQNVTGNGTSSVSKSWWYFTLGFFVVLGIVVLVINSYVSITNENKKRRIIAEFGVGFNPLALLTGKMLSDEGSIGTAHLGLGSNFTIGGKNEVDFHLDFVFKKPIIFVDNKIVWNQFEFVD